jgi:hypothetical protein
MNLVSLIIQIISGAVGGNVAGGLLKQYDLGVLGNSIAGILGGGIGGQLLAMLIGGGATGAGGSMDIGSIIAQVASGGIGGGVLMAIIGIIRQAVSPQGARQ